MASESKRLNPGEKYLSISILGQIKVAAFKNQNKKDSKSPDYKGNGIAVWINEKKANKEAETQELL